MSMVWPGLSGYTNIQLNPSIRGSCVLVCCGGDCSDSHVLDIGLQSQAKRSEMSYILGNHLRPLRCARTLGLHLFRAPNKRPGQQSASSGRLSCRDVVDGHECLCCHLSDTAWGLSLCNLGRSTGDVPLYGLSQAPERADADLVS